MTHLERAKLGLKIIDDTKSNNREYLQDVAARVQIEALVSIAESLEQIVKHGVSVVGEQE